MDLEENEQEIINENYHYFLDEQEIDLQQNNNKLQLEKFDFVSLNVIENNQNSQQKSIVPDNHEYKLNCNMLISNYSLGLDYDNNYSESIFKKLKTNNGYKKILKGSECDSFWLEDENQEQKNGFENILLIEQQIPENNNKFLNNNEKQNKNINKQFKILMNRKDLYFNYFKQILTFFQKNNIQPQYLTLHLVAGYNFCNNSLEFTDSFMETLNLQKNGLKELNLQFEKLVINEVDKNSLVHNLSLFYSRVQQKNSSGLNPTFKNNFNLSIQLNDVLTFSYQNHSFEIILSQPKDLLILQLTKDLILISLDSRIPFTLKIKGNDYQYALTSLLDLFKKNTNLFKYMLQFTIESHILYQINNSTSTSAINYFCKDEKFNSFLNESFGFISFYHVHRPDYQFLQNFTELCFRSTNINIILSWLSQSTFSKIMAKAKQVQLLFQNENNKNIINLTFTQKKSQVLTKIIFYESTIISDQITSIIENSVNNLINYQRKSTSKNKKHELKIEFENFFNLSNVTTKLILEFLYPYCLKYLAEFEFQISVSDNKQDKFFYIFFGLNYNKEVGNQPQKQDQILKIIEGKHFQQQQLYQQQQQQQQLQENITTQMLLLSDFQNNNYSTNNICNFDEFGDNFNISSNTINKNQIHSENNNNQNLQIKKEIEKHKGANKSPKLFNLNKVDEQKHDTRNLIQFCGTDLNQQNPLYTQTKQLFFDYLYRHNLKAHIELVLAIDRQIRLKVYQSQTEKDFNKIKQLQTEAYQYFDITKHSNIKSFTIQVKVQDQNNTPARQLCLSDDLKLVYQVRYKKECLQLKLNEVCKYRYNYNQFQIYTELHKLQKSLLQLQLSQIQSKTIEICENSISRLKEKFRTIPINLEAILDHDYKLVLFQNQKIVFTVIKEQNNFEASFFIKDLQNYERNEILLFVNEAYDQFHNKITNIKMSFDNVAIKPFYQKTLLDAKNSSIFQCFFIGHEKMKKLKLNFQTKQNLNALLQNSNKFRTLINQKGIIRRKLYYQIQVIKKTPSLYKFFRKEKIWELLQFFIKDKNQISLDKQYYGHDFQYQEEDNIDLNLINQNDFLLLDFI